MNEIIQTNEYQTKITQELLDKYPDEVQEQFLDYIDTVPLLKWMIGERPRAKDLPRDDKGRIIVDITHPHILENMDYFRPAAKFFKENGCYSLLKPNANPNSEYGKWFHEEVRRCRDGYVRESDGEWIPGRLYFFLNYSHIMLNRRSETSGIVLRVEDFPDFWEGIYYRYHYLEQARMLGKHCMELARRGCSKSYTMASDMTHNLILGENSENTRRVTTILTAYTKEFLADKDGTISKFTPMVDFCAAHTEFPRLMLKRSMSEMIWRMGYKNSNNNEIGSLNSVMGVSVKDDEGKIRGKRGFIFFEEMGCHLKGTEVLMFDGTIRAVENISVGDLLMGDDGTPRSVQEVHHGYDMMYNVTLTNGDNQIVNSTHLIPHIVRDWYRDTDTFLTATAPELMAKDLTRGYYIPKATLTFKHRDVLLDPYLLGVWLGDGDKKRYTITSPDKEIADYILRHFPDTRVYDLKITDKCWNYYVPAKYGVNKKLRHYGLICNKHIPDDYIRNDSETQLQLLAGLIDTDGNILINKHSSYYEIIQNREHLCILKAARRMAISLGFRCSLRPKIAGQKTKKPGEIYYRLCISGDLDRIPVKVARKKAAARIEKYKQRLNSSRYGFKISEYGYGEFYGFTVDKNHLFVLEDMTITHNSYKNFKEVWNNTRDSVKEGNQVFAQLVAVGTAGDKESDFTGIKTMLYNPDAYEVYALENVYDKKGKGTNRFAYFFPSYISRAGCMDKDGNSDVVAAMLEILMERWMVKQGGDPASLLSRIAQMPVTPAEAILKVKSNFFPVVMLNERLRQLDMNPHIYDDVYVGTLVDLGGRVEFRATDDVPIRKWPVDNTEQGALEIFRMPPTGDIPNRRFIAGCLTPGQMVSTDGGLKKVEDVVLSDKLLNKDGDYVQIKNLQRREKVDETVYSIRLCDTIDRVELTGNHPVYAATPVKKYHNWKTHLKEGVSAVYYEYDFDFKRADELKIGDVVKSPVPYFEERPIPYEKWTRTKTKGLKYIDNPLGKWKFWWLMGLILGDGWCDRTNVYVTFNKNEHQYIDRFLDTVIDVFNRVPVKVHDRTNCVEYQFSSKQCSEFFTKWFGKYAEHKHISEWVKFLPKGARVALLTGYLDSDGCCCKNSMEFVSVSKKLLLDVQDIFLSLGIVSGIKKLRGPKIHALNGKFGVTKDTYSLSVARAGVEKFSKMLGGHDLKLKRFDYRKTANHAIKRCWLSDDGRYVYYKITDISTRQYTGTVYNFECDTHTYMCHHLPVHNCDPVDNDAAESSSLFSVFVFDMFTDEIVAEYTGRKPFAEDNYEMARLLCVFYNATLMVEANRKGYYAYFAKKHATWMLADCPEYLRDRQLVKYSLFGSAAKGISVNSALIGYANDLIRDWLNKTYPVEVKDERGEVHIEQVPQLYRLRNRALIQELISYGPEVNVDRIRALSQVMLYREQFIILYGGSPEDRDYKDDDPADDAFFNKDWERFHNKLGEQYKSILNY